MSGKSVASIAMALFVLGPAATAWQDGSRPPTPKTQMEQCKDAMPTILKNYNDAKYAVFQAGNAGQLGGDAIRRAQAALDAMDEPLRACYEASLDSRKTGDSRNVH